MCEPVTIGVAAATIAGGAIKASAAYNAANQQADILEGNARVADRAAADAVDRGALAEGKVKLQGGALEAHQRQQFAASGVDVQSGSAVDVVSGTAMMTELEAQIAKNNAGREAWGYRTQAGQFRTQAKNARDSGDVQAIGSILGGIGGAAAYGAPSLRVK